MSYVLDELHTWSPDTGRPPPFHLGAVSKTLRVGRDSGKVKLREEGICRMCLRSHAVRRLTRHHLVPQSMFTWGRFGFPGTAGWRLLRDADANIVPLCRQCHDEVELNASMRRFLRRVLTQAEIAFCIQVAGKEWFDRRYPALRPTALE